MQKLSKKERKVIIIMFKHYCSSRKIKIETEEFYASQHIYFLGVFSVLLSNQTIIPDEWLERLKQKKQIKK